MPQPACLTARSSEGWSDGAAAQGSFTCEPLEVGQQLDRKLRWVRVLPVLWSDNYLTIPGGLLSDTQVAPVCLLGCSASAGRLSAKARSRHGMSKLASDGAWHLSQDGACIYMFMHQGKEGRVHVMHACRPPA